MANSITLDSLRKNTASSKSLTIHKIDAEKRLVYGEVYAPNIVDSHGDAMLAEDIETMAHAFLSHKLNDHIDVMHDNKPVMATCVESFIARKDDPDFVEGAWVMVTKIYDDKLWAEIKKGVYSGYSMEVRGYKRQEIVEIETESQIFCFSEENNGHTHICYVKMDEYGKVVGGLTSFDNGHSHVIKSGTATEHNQNHSHRFLLP